MTTKKKTTRRKRAADPRDTRTVEFTPAQFLGAIVTLVCFGLVCFVLGIIVNRVDNARRADEVAAVQQGEGQQIQPAATVANAPPPLEVAEAAPVQTRKESFRTIPVPEGPNSKRAEAVSEPATEEPKAPEKTPDPKPETKPTQTAKAPAKTTPPPPPPTATEEKPEAKKPVVAPPTDPNGNWTIQVAAYASDNRERAETFIKTIEADTGIRPKLVPSPDGKFLRVWIGQFSDKAEADAMKAELQNTPALKGCIVKPMG